MDTNYNQEDEIRNRDDGLGVEEDTLSDELQLFLIIVIFSALLAFLFATLYYQTKRREVVDRQISHHSSKSVPPIETLVTALCVKSWHASRSKSMQETVATVSEVADETERAIEEGLAAHDSTSEGDGAEKVRDLECAICLGEFSEGEQVCHSRSERCNHTFHLECMTNWLRRKGAMASCPVCRQLYVDSSKREV